ERGRLAGRRRRAAALQRHHAGRVRRARPSVDKRSRRRHIHGRVSGHPVSDGMTHSISPGARQSQDAIAKTDEEVVLFRIEHPDLDEVIRLSSDPTTVVSMEPYAMGTYSTWLTDDGSPFLFVLMGVDVPSDKTDEP